MSTKYPVDFKQVSKLATVAMFSGTVPFIHGSPAIGKSAAAHGICEKHNLQLIDWRGSTADPVDLSGLPDLVGDKAVYKPFDTFPIEGDILPEGKAGWLLFMDEFNSAPRSVAAAAYKLILDRKVGNHNLHNKVYIIAAGNLSTDGAITNDLGTALQSRMVHLHMKASKPLFMEYAANQKFEADILAFLEYKPSQFYNFNPDHQEYTYPSPRTWEFMDKQLKTIKRSSMTQRQALPLLAGTIGDGAATEFNVFCEIKNELVPFSEIVKNPTSCKLAQKPSHQYATCAFIAENITELNAEKVMMYVNRMPTEFQFLTLKMAVKLVPEILSIPVVDDWYEVNAEKLFRGA
jgi:hypothetical protein